MGKSILAAVLAAILASLATTLVMRSLADDQVRTTESRLVRAEQRATDAEERVRTALDRIDRFGDRVQRAEVAASEANRNALSAVQAAGAEPVAGGAPLTAPDGSPYVSRADLDQALAALPAAGTGGIGFTPPPTKKSLEEIAADMALTAQQESTLRVILRDAEQELVNLLFGNRPIEDVKEEVRRAKIDPDRMSELVQSVAIRGFGNLGKVATWETRLRRKVEDTLGQERAAEFLAKPRKPVLDENFEEIFEEAF